MTQNRISVSGRAKLLLSRKSTRLLGSAGASPYRDRYATGESFLVGSLQKLSSKFGPLFTERFGEHLERNPVGTRGTAIRFDVLPGGFHVAHLDDFFHQKR